MAKSLAKPQRLKLMMQIADFFANDSYIEIDTALETFSFPVFDQADGQKSYVLRSLKTGSDDQILELAHCVSLTAPFGIDIPVDVLAVSPKDTVNIASNDNIVPQRFGVFISHLAKERECAAKLKLALDVLGIDAFVAHNDIEPTAEWQIEIEHALSKCDAMIALLHNDFHASNWTDQEIGWALGRNVPVYAVRMGADPYGFFGKAQAFNGNNKSESQIADEVFTALAKDGRTALRISASLVKLIEEAGSYSQARSRISILERAVVWDSSLTDALQKTVASNDQISGAWNVPGRIDAFIAKFG